MLLFATLTIACLGMPPQGTGTPQDKALLTPAEQKSLQTKLAKLIEARRAYDEPGNDKAREKAQKDYEKAKDAFQTEWDGKLKQKGDLLKSMVDMQAVFAACLPYERKSAVSLRKVDAKDGLPAYFLSVPKSYKAETPTRTVLLLPGLDEKSEWTEGKRWVEATWTEKATLFTDSIVHVPVIPKEIDLDPVPDYSKSEGEGTETKRIQQLMQSFGETQRQFQVDRSRLFLDAGKGGCGFALRVATHFPDRFAGIILRDPSAVDEIRLGSLFGVRVLLLSSAATADACKALKTRFDAVDPAVCTILETADAYPFKAAAPEIEKWMGGVQRVVNHKKVVLEPNDDRFKKAFWVQIETMEAIQTAPAGKKPRIEVEADRAANRVTIKAVGIESLVLQLNDALIDLDKDFTIVVNDKATTEKRGRDFNRMLDSMLLRFDPDFLFPVQFRVRVPKPEPKPADTKPADAGAGK